MRVHIEKIWMAGFFDGEGWISIVKHQPSLKAPSLRYTLEVGVANTEISLVEPFLKKFGGHIDVDTSGRWKTCFKWKVCAKKAIVFLAFIKPYVQDPRRRAMLRLAMKFQAHQHHGGWRSNQFVRRPTPRIYRVVQERYWQKMRELNHRGNPDKILSESIIKPLVESPK